MIQQQSAASCQLSAIKRISLKILIVAFIFTCYAPLPDVAAAETVNELVDRIQGRLAGVHDIKGTFAQTSLIRDLEETQKYAGKFFIKKPSHMMWEYDKPRDEKVVINGSDTWIYKKSQNQVMKTTFSSEAYSQVPIALIVSMENIRNDFAIILTRENALQLTPKRKIGFIKTLVIETSSADFPIKMFTIFDTYGNIIMMDLYDVKTNPGLDDSLFQFTVPEGAEVFDLNE